MTREIKAVNKRVRSKTHKAEGALTAASEKKRKKQQQIDKQWNHYEKRF